MLCIIAGTTPHGRAADIWALGVYLYCFIFGTCPFLGNNIVDIYHKIRNDEYVPLSYGV